MLADELPFFPSARLLGTCARRGRAASTTAVAATAPTTRRPGSSSTCSTSRATSSRPCSEPRETSATGPSAAATKKACGATRGSRAPCRSTCWCSPRGLPGERSSLRRPSRTRWWRPASRARRSTSSLPRSNRRPSRRCACCSRPATSPFRLRGPYRGPGELRAALRGSWSRLEQCYEATLARHPDLGGRMELRFEVGDDGTLANVVEAGTRFSDAETTRVWSASIAAPPSLLFAQSSGQGLHLPGTLRAPVGRAPGTTLSTSTRRART